LGVARSFGRLGGRISGAEFDATLTALGRAALPYGTHIALLALRAFQPLDDLPISRRPGLSRILHWPYCCLSTCFDSTQKIVPLGGPVESDDPSHRSCQRDTVSISTLYFGSSTSPTLRPGLFPRRLSADTDRAFFLLAKDKPQPRARRSSLCLWPRWASPSHDSC